MQEECTGEVFQHLGERNIRSSHLARHRTGVVEINGNHVIVKTAPGVKCN